MTQIRKNISISQEVYEHIKKQQKRYGFDFSKWVEETYAKTAMDPEKILKDIETAKIAVAQMEYDYEVLKEIRDSRVIMLSKDEKRWITSELRQRLSSSGNNWVSITNFFNAAFNRNLNKQEFNTLALEVLHESRTEYAKNA